MKRGVSCDFCDRSQCIGISVQCQYTACTQQNIKTLFTLVTSHKEKHDGHEFQIVWYVYLYSFVYPALLYGTDLRR